jgi:hypothetical protein
MDNHTFDDWMGAHAGRIGSLSLRHLVLLGSHDSGTWDTFASLPPAPNADRLKTAALRSFALRPLVKKFAQAQVREQLNCSARYFDLRVARCSERQ